MVLSCSWARKIDKVTTVGVINTGAGLRYTHGAGLRQQAAVVVTMRGSSAVTASP